MGTLNSWDVVDGNNNLAPPDGWPENTMNYSDVNNTGRAVQGTMKRFFSDINGTLDAAGAADVYTLTLNETGYTAYFDGMIFACSIPATNLTTTPTIDVNGIGAQTIVDRLGNALGIGELMSGGIYEFRYDGTNMRLVGSGGVSGLDTQFQFNNGGIFGGSPGLTYNTGNDEATSVNPFNLSNDAVFAEQADHTSTPGSGFGYLWVRDDNPTVLVFTNSNGVDTVLGVAGSTSPGGADTQLQYNDGGSFGGISEFTFNDSTLQVEYVDPVATSSSYRFLIQADGLTNGNGLRVDVGQSGNLNNGSAVIAVMNAGGGNPTTSAAFRGASLNNSSCFIGTVDDDGHGLYLYSDSTNRSLALAYMEYDDGSPGATILQIQNDSVDNASPSIEFTGNVGGIRFDPTLNRSTEDNTLDDYEEQEFTTAWTADGGGTITLNGGVDTMGVTKVGSIVHCQGQIQVGSVSAPTGEIRMDLPYNTVLSRVGNFANTHIAMCLFSSGWLFATPEYGHIVFGGNDTYCVIRRLNDGNIADEAQAGATVLFNFWYITDE